MAEKGYMGSTAGMGVRWDSSTGPSWIGKGISSLATEMLVWLVDPFYYSFFILVFLLLSQ